MRIKRIVATGIVAGALSLAVGSSALAGTASTPVGYLTATQAAGPCNDFGAVVNVGVTGGFANKAYTATGSTYSTAAYFTTNGAGAGSGQVLNVKPVTGWSGTATITVTANGKTGTVPVAITCNDPKGDK